MRAPGVSHLHAVYATGAHAKTALLAQRPAGAGWKGVGSGREGLHRLKLWLAWPALPTCPHFTPTTGYSSTSHESVRLVRRHRFSSDPPARPSEVEWRRGLPLSPLHAPRSRPHVYCVRACPFGKAPHGPSHRIRAAPLSCSAPLLASRRHADRRRRHLPSGGADDAASGP